MIYLTGDTHGRFERIGAFCDKMQTDRDDILIILGDAGINFHADVRDILRKEHLAKLPVNIENDCRIILESARIIAHTSDSGVAESRRKLIGERYAHLMTLKPFAERSSCRLIFNADKMFSDTFIALFESKNVGLIHDS